MDTLEQCKLCGEGHVTIHVREVHIEYKDTHAHLPIQFKVCDRCTSDYVDFAISVVNKQTITDYKAKIDREISKS